MENLIINTALEWTNVKRKGALIGITNLILGTGSLIQTVFIIKTTDENRFLLSTANLIVSAFIFIIFQLFFVKKPSKDNLINESNR